MNKVQTLRAVSKLWNLELFYTIGVNQSSVSLQGEICKESMTCLADSGLNVNICSTNGYIEARDSESIEGCSINICLTFNHH